MLRKLVSNQADGFTARRTQLLGAVGVSKVLMDEFRSQVEARYECIVAPYEADAQCAYLSKIQYVRAVVTEDSDLLMLGTQTVSSCDVCAT